MVPIERQCNERRENRYSSWQKEQPQQPKYWDWPLSLAISAVRPVLQSLAVFPIQKLVMPRDVQGQENLKDLKGPVIFAANHLSHLDTPCP